MAKSCALEELARQIGEGVSDLSFQLSIENDTIRLGAERFDLALEAQDEWRTTFSGQWRDIRVLWEFQPAEGGYWVTLRAESEHSLDCSSMDSLILTYRPDTDSLMDWRVPTKSFNGGMVLAGDLDEEEFHTAGLFRGAFENSGRAGLFLGTFLPQRHTHDYTVQVPDEHTLHFTCTTRFVEGPRKMQELLSERTWVCATKNVREAIEAYATHIPPITPPPQPPVGWSSWDYYFRAISLDDVIENMEEICQDPALAQHVKYIVVDDGWQVVWGEWYANHRFPGGIERLAEEIRSRGFVPGIWTAPVAVQKLSKTALRSYEFLVKDEYGDPQGTEFPDHYIVDPTHPLGREFIKETYTRLFEAGFRFYKVDFVSTLLRAKRFHDPTQGPYDVLRGLFSLIRECVTGESHILRVGSMEVGPGAHSMRLGADIHNQWTHVAWQCEDLQFLYWLHNRAGVLDPDFMIVRGQDTSLEQETNVLNPKAHHPNPPRWRRGPTFTLDEARTWGSLVAVAGGSLFLSDRIRMLNEAGKEMIRRLIVPTGVGGRPLDLCEGFRPSVWLQQLEDTYRLLIVNWAGEARERAFPFQVYGLAAPREVMDFWTGEKIEVRGGELAVNLAPHASALVCWNT